MTKVAATVRENVKLRRCVRLFSPGHIATYVHNAVAPGSGLVASAVAFEAEEGQLCDAARTQLEAVGKHIAMQVRHAAPKLLLQCLAKSSTAAATASP